ncbi:MAG: hypothetical protein Q4Q06_07815 [Bacteroidota bacterium]|nr:hypothetical protein [Bacteroidota bacterium]
MKGYFFCLCCCLSLISMLFAQKEKDYYKSMQRAINEKNYILAKNVFSIANEEEYYDMSSLERLLCRVHYMEKDYKASYLLAKKLFDEDENDFLSDVIRWTYLSKDKNNDSIFCEELEEYDFSNFANSVLYDLDIMEKEDLKSICLCIERKLASNDDLSRAEKQSYNTLSTLLYYKQKNYMQAYNKAIDIFSTDNISVMDFVLGQIKEESKEYASAIAFYNSAIRKGYKDYEAYLHRALCKGYNTDYLSANIDLDTCLSIREDYFVYYLKGVNYNHLRDYNNALYALCMSISLCDTFAQAYNYRGIVYSNAEKYEIALLDFRTCLALDKKTPYIHDNIGIALERTGNIPAAIEEYLLSIKYEPKYFDAYYNLGRIYTNYHYNSKALRYLRKALKLETEVSDIYFLIGQNLLEMGKKDYACEYFFTALEMGHTEAEEKISSIDCNKEEKKK